MEIPLSVHLPRLYSDVMLAPLGFIAVAIAMARAFDAITDPAMGWVSDRTRTRLGRRLPWIILGVPLSSMAYYALFNPSADFGALEISLWFCVSFMLYFMFSTMYQIPQEALGAEMTQDYHERSSLFGFLSFFTVVGFLVGAITPVILQQGFKLEIREAYGRMGLIYGLMLMALFIPFVVKLRERPGTAQHKPNPLVPGVRRALRNRPFRILIGAAIMTAIPVGIPPIMMPYLTYYVLQPENPEFWLMMNLLALAGSGFVFLPLWVILARRVGKLRARMLTAPIGISGVILLFFIGPGDTWQAFFTYVYLGSQTGARLFLLPAMGADVIDYDELRTGQRREGQFTSFWAYIPKLVAVPSLSVPLAVMGAMGYVPNQAQTPEVLFAIRTLTSFFPAFFFTIGFFIIIHYPLSEKVHQAIRAGIDAHKRGEDATDPFSHEVLPPHHVDEAEDAMGWRLNNFSFAELRRLQRQGPERLVRDVYRSILVSLSVLGFFVALAAMSIADLETKPGVMTVAWIVSSGFALTAALYHTLRLKPARQMVSDPVAEESITRHLQNEY